MVNKGWQTNFWLTKTCQTNNKSRQTKIWLTKAGKHISGKQKIKEASKQIYGKQIYVNSGWQTNFWQTQTWETNV